MLLPLLRWPLDVSFHLLAPFFFDLVSSCISSLPQDPLALCRLVRLLGIRQALQLQIWRLLLPIGSLLRAPVLEFNHGPWSSRAYACVQSHHGALTPSSSEQAFLLVCYLPLRTPSRSLDWRSMFEAPYQALEHMTAWTPILPAQRAPFMLFVSSSL